MRCWRWLLLSAMPLERRQTNVLAGHVQETSIADPAVQLFHPARRGDDKHRATQAHAKRKFF
jgi:hypothetical protein